MKHLLIYRFWGMVSNSALSAYHFAPREMLQDEFFQLHRYALKKAHNARVKGESESGFCRHTAPLCWGTDDQGRAYLMWCNQCGAICAVESGEIPSGEWVTPQNAEKSVSPTI